MSHAQAVDDELAITSKLEQVNIQLAEKDLEIESLKQELTRLRRRKSQTDTTGTNSTPSSVVNFGSEDHEDGSTELEYPEFQGPEHRGPGSGEDSGPENHQASSYGCWDSVPTVPMACGNGSTGGLGDGGSPWGNECSGQPFEFIEPPKENWRNAKLRPGSKSWLHPLSFRAPAHTLSDVEINDILYLHALPLKTRLEDEDWLDSPLEHICVDDEFLYHLLTRGRELAKKCLWKHLDKNRPDIRRREFPGGWHQIKLESRRLDEALDTQALNLRQNCGARAQKVLYKVVDIRNFTSHWNHGELGWDMPATRKVDELLKDVQKLAIHLYDEKSAAKARRLRDEAHQAVEDTVSEIKALESQFDECAWKYHHVLMFEKIERAKEDKTMELLRYPDVIFRAAEAWSRRRTPEPIFDEEPAHWDADVQKKQPTAQEEENNAGIAKDSDGKDTLEAGVDDYDF